MGHSWPWSVNLSPPALPPRASISAEHSLGRPLALGLVFKGRSYLLSYLLHRTHLSHICHRKVIFYSTSHCVKAHSLPCFDIAPLSFTTRSRNLDHSKSAMCIFVQPFAALL